MSGRILPVSVAAELTRSEDRWLRHSAERLRARTRPLRRPLPAHRGRPVATTGEADR